MVMNPFFSSCNFSSETMATTEKNGLKLISLLHARKKAPLTFDSVGPNPANDPHHSHRAVCFGKILQLPGRKEKVQLGILQLRHKNCGKKQTIELQEMKARVLFGAICRSHSSLSPPPQHQGAMRHLAFRKPLGSGVFKKNYSTQDLPKPARQICRFPTVCRDLCATSLNLVATKSCVGAKSRGHRRKKKKHSPFCLLSCQTRLIVPCVCGLRWGGSCFVPPSGLAGGCLK